MTSMIQKHAYAYKELLQEVLVVFRKLENKRYQSIWSKLPEESYSPNVIYAQKNSLVKAPSNQELPAIGFCSLENNTEDVEKPVFESSLFCNKLVNKLLTLNDIENNHEKSNTETINHINSHNLDNASRKTSRSSSISLEIDLAPGEYDNEAFEQGEETQNYSSTFLQNHENSASEITESSETVYLTCSSSSSVEHEQISESEDFDFVETNKKDTNSYDCTKTVVVAILIFLVPVVTVITYLIYCVILTQANYNMLVEENTTSPETNYSSILITIHNLDIYRNNKPENINVKISLNDASHWQVEDLNLNIVIKEITEISIHGPFQFPELLLLLSQLPKLRSLHLNNLNDELCIPEKNGNFEIVPSNKLFINSLQYLTLERFSGRCNKFYHLFNSYLEFTNLKELKLIEGSINDENVDEIRKLLYNSRMALKHVEISDTKITTNLVTYTDPGLMPTVQSITFKCLPNTNPSYIFGDGFSSTFLNLEKITSLNLPLKLDQTEQMFNCIQLEYVIFGILVSDESSTFLADKLAENIKHLKHAEVDLEFSDCKNIRSETEKGFSIYNFDTIFQKKLPHSLLEKLKVYSNCAINK